MALKSDSTMRNRSGQTEPKRCCAAGQASSRRGNAAADIMDKPMKHQGITDRYPVSATTTTPIIFRKSFPFRGDRPRRGPRTRARARTSCSRHHQRRARSDHGLRPVRQRTARIIPGGADSTSPRTRPDHPRARPPGRFAARGSPDRATTPAETGQRSVRIPAVRRCG